MSNAVLSNSLKTNETTTTRTGMSFQQVMMKRKEEMKKNVTGNKNGFVMSPSIPDNVFPNKYPKPSHNHQAVTNGTEQQPPMQQTGVSIIVKLKVRTQQVVHSKFLCALLQCFKLRDPWAAIVVPVPHAMELSEKQTTGIKKNLFTSDDALGCEESIAELYLEEPMRKFSSEFRTRIQVSTSVPFNLILKDKSVQKWLREEKVQLELNNLKSNQLTNVGYLFEVVPKEESIPFYEKRIKEMLPENIPEFHIIISTINIEKFSKKLYQNGVNQRVLKSRVLMIRATKSDFSVFQRALSNIRKTKDNELVIHPWYQFLNFSTGQKRTVVWAQDNFIKAHKTSIPKIRRNKQRVSSREYSETQQSNVSPNEIKYPHSKTITSDDSVSTLKCSNTKQTNADTNERIDYLTKKCAELTKLLEIQSKRMDDLEKTLSRKIQIGQNKQMT